MKHKAKPRKAQQPIYTFFRLNRFHMKGEASRTIRSEHSDHPAEKHGKKVFIRYALPGETVACPYYSQCHKRLEEADKSGIAQ